MTFKTTRILAAVLGAGLLAVSCESLSDALFLDANVSDAEKARMVTEAGIAEYRKKIVAEGDIAAMDKVRRYFEVAQRYDPSSQAAKVYLARLKDFRESKFREYLKKGQDLAKKANRKEEDDYAMSVAFQKAASIDALDSDVIRLGMDTAKTRETLVAAYLSRSNASLGKIGKATQDPERERLYLDAFNNVAKATDVEPRNVEATGMRRNLTDEIGTIMRTRVDNLEAVYAKGDFASGVARIGQLKDLDRKLGGGSQTVIRDAEYDLYCAWASWFLERKDWSKAEAKADTALAVKKGTEAAAIKTRISETRDKAEQGSSFETALASIDSFLEKDDLQNALRVIASTARNVKSESQKKAIGLRRDRIRAQLETLYQKGVGYYREERFDKATEILELVVSIEPEYEQAAEYLDKATVKKKLLEQY